MARIKKKKITKASTHRNSCSNENFESGDLKEERDHVENINITSPRVNLTIYSPSVRNNHSKVAIPSVIQQIHIYCNHHDENLTASENKQSNEQTYLLPIAPPIFGNLKFYSKDKSSKEVVEKTNENPETPRSRRNCRNLLENNTKKTVENNYKGCPLIKDNSKNDVQKKGKKRKVSENPQPDDSKNRTMHYNLRSDRNKNLEKQSEGVSDNTLLSKYKDFKLKKALVVLKDISKSNAWHHILIGHSESEFRNKSPTDSLKKSESQREDSEGERFSVKNEILSLSSSPVKEYLNNSPSTNNSFKSNGVEIESQGVSVSTPNTLEPSFRCERLTAAAEGCNFSEILSKFGGNITQGLLDSVESSVNNELNVKSGSCSEPDEANDDCYDDTTKDNSFEDTCKSDSDSGRSKIESDSESKNDVNGNMSYKGRYLSFDDEPSAQITNDNASDIADEPQSLKDNNEEKFKRNSPLECLIKECCDTGSISDENNIFSEEHSTSELVVDFKSCKKESPFKISPKHKSSLRVSNTQKYNSLIDLGNVDLQLHLIKKEIERRSALSFAESQVNTMPKMKKKSDANISEKLTHCEFKSSLIRNRGSCLETPEEKPEKSTPPKKPKLLKKNSKKEALKSSSLDYIPLNAPGSTKFAVAPLDAINPYQSHSAKSFKKEMLFGNRVARFSKPDEHRVYQLKKAGRKLARK